MNDKEKKIHSERLIEATKNGYTGLEGKFGTILRHLGHPIIAEGGSFYVSNEMPDVYEMDVEETMPTMDEDQTVMELGHIFDGLSSGIHLEIKYLSEKQELNVYYQGYQVYGEIASELTCYVPSPDWEEKIEMLYRNAKVRENKKRDEHIMENRQELERQKVSLLDKLRLRWGV